MNKLRYGLITTLLLCLGIVSCKNEKKEDKNKAKVRQRMRKSKIKSGQDQGETRLKT